jgi:hypothetical protein
MQHRVHAYCRSTPKVRALVYVDMKGKEQAQMVVYSSGLRMVVQWF